MRQKHLRQTDEAFRPRKRKRGPIEYIQTFDNNYFDNTKKINPVTKGKKLFQKGKDIYKRSKAENGIFVSIFYL